MGGALNTGGGTMTNLLGRPSWQSQAPGLIYNGGLYGTPAFQVPAPQTPMPETAVRATGFQAPPMTMPEIAVGTPVYPTGFGMQNWRR